QDKRRLVELSDEFDRAAAQDAVTADDVDINLHLHIVRATRYRHLYEMVENSKIETTVLHGLAISRVESAEEVAESYRLSIGCHRPLVEALLGGDPEAAERAVSAHIDTGLEVILRTEERTGRVAAGFGHQFADFPWR
ncbi:MAG: FCD domain-containing protein, partial [Bryobacteraceae bacterium]